MKTSRTTLRSDSGYFLHLGIAVVLALLAKDHLMALPFFVAEMLFLWTRLRRLFFPALFLCLVGYACWFWRASRIEGATGTEWVGTVVEAGLDSIVVQTRSARIVVYGEAAGEMEPGDRVSIHGETYLPAGYRMEHAFDYGDYLASEGIDAAVFAQTIEKTGHRFHLNLLRSRTEDYLRARFPGDSGGMILYVLMGNDDYVPETLIESIRQLGISHLFAISGMNIAMIVGFLDQVLRRLFLHRGVRKGIIGTILGIYVVLTGFSLSVMRAVLMVVAVFLQEGTRLPFSRLDWMGFLLAGFLVINPYLLSSLGFSLSFLLAIAIVVGKDLLKTTGKMGGVLKIGLYSNLVALPLLLETDPQFNLLSIPANLFFVLFVEQILLPGTFLTAFVPGFFPLFQWLFGLFRSGIAWMNGFEASVTVNFSWDGSKALYFVLILLVLYGVEAKQKIAGKILAIGMLLVTEWSAASLPGVRFVKILDVGQGDAIYLRDGSTNILIDTGNIDDYDTLLAYFQGENVHRLDVVFLTHDHSDHVGEILDLLEGLDIGQIVIGSEIESLEGFELTRVTTGEEIRCGNLNFRVLSADRGSTDENDNSMVLAVTIGCHDWLFMGDAGTAVESEILQQGLPSFDIVKIGHHGSDTASGVPFVEACSPLAAVISVGKGNSYGHPSLGIPDRWEETEAAVFRTDVSGTLEFWYGPWGNRCVVFAAESGTFFDNEIFRMVRIF